MSPVTEKTSQSWISRLGGSIKSIFFGLILLVGSIVLMWYNEGRAVKTAKGLKEGGAQVVSIETNKVDPGNNGKLVHVSGRMETADSLSDDQFGIKVNALKLKRTVQMYQWAQKSSRSTRKKIGGGEETVTTYSYEKKWSSSLIKSDNFKELGHDNPSSMPYAGYTKTATNVNIGKFKIPESIKSKVSGFYEYAFDAIDTTLVKDAVLVNDGVHSSIYKGEGTSGSPQIGDIRISFDIVSPGDYSIIAKQFNNTFERYTTSNGTNLEMLENGLVSAENMFKAAISGNKTMTWVLRFVGVLMMFIAFKTILKPIVVVGDLIPFVGNILSFGTSLASGLATIALAFVVIAIAWVFYRPILGVSLLVVGGGIFFYLFKRGKKKKELQQAEGTK